MKIEQLLYEYPYIKVKLDEIRQEIMEAEALMDGAYAGLSCPLSRLGQAPLTSGRVGDPTGQAAILACDHLSDRLERLYIQRTQLVKAISQVHLMLSGLTQREKQVVDLRYFKRRRPRDIINIMDCSRQKCHHHQVKALEKMRQVIAE